MIWPGLVLNNILGTNKNSGGEEMRIIRFDHISYIAANKDKEKVFMRFADHFADKKLKFSEIGIENLDSKKLLMCRKDQKTHDLYFFEGGGLDIEVILYNEISGKSKVRLGSDTIYASCMNLEAIAACFQKIGIAEEKRRGQEIVYNLKGWLGKQNIYLEIQEHVKSREAYLDDEGFGCVTLLVDSLSGLEEISDSKNLVTKAERITINKRQLDVCFWKNTELNIIFEFITAGKG